ncbi:MAG: hypothetical protein O3C63_04865 [Cyanobacteria bacterium]|nr:hypothetical protein [Cyanobacteriota bacterium]MDA1020574.1 hypothetical protein [Cyanobacteriota bacterium]
MSIGGLSNIRPGGNQQQSGQGAGANGESAGKEFSLEQQTSGAAAQAGKVRSHDVSNIKLTKIVTNKKKNRKGAPRTILVDGEIYEVYLLAIA